MRHGKSEPDPLSTADEEECLPDEGGAVLIAADAGLAGELSRLGHPCHVKEWDTRPDIVQHAGEVFVISAADDDSRADASNTRDWARKHCSGLVAMVVIPGLGIEYRDLRSAIEAGLELHKLIGTARAGAVKGRGRQAKGNGKSRGKGEPEHGEPETHVDVLLRLADAGATLFHEASGKTYAAVKVDDHVEVHEIGSEGFRRWLRHEFYKERGRAPSSQAFSDAIGILDCRAMYEGSREETYVRVASVGPDVYLDIGDESRRAVKVDADGWSIIANPPVRFRRPSGLLPLPEPVKGGSLEQLRRFVNVDDGEYLLFVAWLVATLRGVGSFVVLVLVGEQGSAKSTLARLTRSLVDAHLAPLRCEPKDVRDLMIAARRSWVICLDNLSVVYPWLSDALCRLSTGGAVSTRVLYSNDEETFLEAMRPVILTGITDFVNRGDLIDRCLFLHLQVITPEKRKPESEIYREFNEVAPGILGALLDLLVAAMRGLPDVELAALPRMAEFALIGEATSRALAHPPGKFIQIYNDNRACANQSAVSDSPLANAILELAASEGSWAGTATKLWAELRDMVAPDDSSTSRANLLLLPKSPNALSGALKRMAPQLRLLGVDIIFSTRSNKHRMIVILSLEPEKEEKGSSPSSPPSPGDANLDQDATCEVTTDGDGSEGDRHPSPADRHPNGASSPDRHPSSPDRHPATY